MGESVHSGLVKLFIKAHDNVAATGREPQAVEPKIISPLLRAASLETDETLIDMWAALLANAADPASKATMLVRFIEVLRLLSPPEVIILQHFDTKRREMYYVPKIGLGSLATRLGMAEDEFELAANSLIVSGLCELPLDEFKVDSNGDLIQRRPSKDELTLSALGVSFLDAVTPPAP